MFIDHISMYSDNPEKSKEFYETYFDGESNEALKNDETDTFSYFLSFGGGGSAKLEIIKRPDIQRFKKNHIDLGYLRLAFMQDSEDGLKKKVEQLRNDGYQIIQEPHIGSDGYYKALILDPGDNQVELIYGRPGGLHCPVDKQRKKK